MFDGDEYEDQLIGDPNQLDDLIEARDLNPLEDEQNGEGEEAEEQDQDKGEDNSDQKATKRRVIRNPQPKLDPQRLTGPRGIATIEGLFRDFKFLGRGYEEQDLKRVLERLELWGNRLFPKYQFDDLLEKVEKLGLKKPVMNFVNKIRMGIVTEDSVAEHPENLIEDVEMDLDDLPQENNVNADADDLFTQLIEQQLSQVESKKQQDKPPVPQIEISEEQRQRMLQNRRLAEERRLARLKAQQEKESSLDESSQPNHPSQKINPCEPIHLESHQSEVAEEVHEKKDGGEIVDFNDAVVSLAGEQNDPGMEISAVPVNVFIKLTETAEEDRLKCHQSEVAEEISMVNDGGDDVGFGDDAVSFAKEQNGSGMEVSAVPVNVLREPTENVEDGLKCHQSEVTEEVSEEKDGGDNADNNDAVVSRAQDQNDSGMEVSTVPLEEGVE